ncbi:NADH-quinone oxidoreductase subunit J [Ketogulonicigenium vulgare]|uniref:NADH-quinone oxidoreductase subunit J n=1 Tax=Ketogulonicigenium vulgare (strain WSH-001) TaxID=759362 RepID=F9Y3W2_KETVW|nr:NADH-quinone oxidoreductase subunit J [Ketogulonicigenium vulgare]ADO43368.1 NADH dehydrogenase subunit J [Ketogulonicigenium vulgare Y25]AEM41653.1 NADH dehydrogenase I chain J transmembrane protein [Ketogulonicigenium vulgare WSH-001]ALJ81765.1 NADH:ubiquinone oxidoreductase subunit J [Ketogulonicigenium vulgare]ANW34423.1 NADH:ubiquinone oxidoreductase subunit J [Ketogulonicigenium vulgare]AOZ55403.1 NADH dehydrogenase subunit J [Ketogulonicigenium vulgare]
MAFIFYVFAAGTLIGGLMTVTARNPVHAVLWLISAFLSAAGLFVLQGAEFVAMILMIVYVGAVAVLFLFVVMMLDVDFAALRAKSRAFVPVGVVIGAVLAAQLVMVFGDWSAAPGASARLATPTPAGVDNTHALALILYDRYFIAFQLAGLVLLVAMIGAIVLTMRHRQDVKRQNVLEQMSRDPAKAIRMANPGSGQGLDRSKS